MQGRCAMSEACVYTLCVCVCVRVGMWGLWTVAGVGVEGSAHMRGRVPSFWTSVLHTCPRYVRSVEE